MSAKPIAALGAGPTMVEGSGFVANHRPRSAPSDWKIDSADGLSFFLGPLIGSPCDRQPLRFFLISFVFLDSANVAFGRDVWSARTQNRKDTKVEKSYKNAIVYAQAACVPSFEPSSQITAQIDAAMRFCATNRWNIEAIFPSTGNKEKGIQPLLRYLEVRPKSPFVLVVRDPSRISRQVDTFRDMLGQVEERGGTLWMCGLAAPYRDMVDQTVQEITNLLRRS